jgi:hypothetical protein
VSFAETIAHAKPRLRKAIINHCEDKHIKYLCNLSHHGLYGGVRWSPNQKKILGPYRNTVIKLGNKRISLKQKRKILSQEGGFLGTLILPVLKALGHIFLS